MFRGGLPILVPNVGIRSSEQSTAADFLGALSAYHHLKIHSCKGCTHPQ